MKKQTPKRLEQITILMPVEELVIFMNDSEMESFKKSVFEEIYQKFTRCKPGIFERFLIFSHIKKPITVEFYKIDVHLTTTNLKK